MEVRLVNFPETRVALLPHRDSPATEHATVLQLVQWKLQHQLLDQERYRTYGLHYLPGTAPDSEHRVDFCLSIHETVEPNTLGIVESTIPTCRCALARDIGSRLDNQAVKYLVYDWLPRSGETVSGAPIIFHYVNVGPTVKASDAITDVYLPLHTQCI